MDKNYKEPTIEFLKERFSGVPFGMVKPSEMELLLFYVLAYHDDDLQKSEFKLAQKYCITERKAANFKIEIAKRFAVNNDSTVYMLQLAKDIFESKKIILDWDGGTKIGIPVYNPCRLRAFKQSLSENQIPYDTGNNGNLIKLTTGNFIAIFAKCGYDEIKNHIKETIKKQLDGGNEYQKVFDYGTPLTFKANKFLQENAGTILCAIPVVKDILPAAKVLGNAASAMVKNVGK
jgi:hypothetical protein